MAFVKGAWKILVGIKDGLVLIFMLLFFALLFAALSWRGNAGRIDDGALLLRLKGTISEQPAEADPFASLAGEEDAPREYRARDILHALDAAKSDARVKAVALDLDGFVGAGAVTLADVGRRLDAVKKAGKPVYAYATSYSADGYQLAAHASEVWMDPIGSAFVAGPGGTNLYFKALIDRLGINARIFRVGTYKSAVEPFMRDGPSPEATAAEQALLDDMWAASAQRLRAARPRADFATYVQRPADALAAAGGDAAVMAKRAGLIDTLGSRQAFEAAVAAKAGKATATDDPARPERFAAIDFDDFLAAHPAKEEGAAIAVVTVAGPIMDGEQGPGTAGGETISRLIDDVVDEGEAKALVLRVDSPGGSVVASEQIRRAAERAKAKGLPVVVSMANLAASGGYWVSTPADAIFADPATITGSIGIFGLIPTFEKTLANIGVGTASLRTTPLSGEPNIAGGLSPEMERVIQTDIESGYRRFVALVAKSRGKTAAEVDAMAQGRVWAGGPARQLGLVDRFGSLDDALAEAARRAKLTSWYADHVEPEPDPFIAFLSAFSGDESKAAQGRDLIGLVRRERALLLRDVEAQAGLLLGTEGAQARCLECTGMVPATAAPRRSGDTLLLSLLARLSA